MKIDYLLATRSFFSIGESLMSPKEIVETAHRRGYGTVALVDTMTISGMTDLSNAVKKIDGDMKAIVGCRLRIIMDLEYRKPGRNVIELPKDNPEWYPKVYVKNEKGMKDLLGLLSLANDEDHFYHVARLSFKDLLVALKRGNLAFSTGDINGLFHVNCNKYNYASILKLIYAHTDKASVFLELSSVNTILSRTLAKKVSQSASECEGQLLATYPAFYKDEKDADTLDVLATITQNNKITDPWRHIPFIRDFSIKPPSANIKRLLTLDKALKRDGVTIGTGNAVEGMKRLSDLCEYVWEPLEVSLPKIVEDEHAALMKEVTIGWKSRLGVATLGYLPDKSTIPVYKKRLAYEIGILNKMGFERYFLVVQELVKWSKDNDIKVGPGRGSAGGSLVAYLMGITDVDPIRFNLIFERFINPDRLDLPDADLDFMSTRRHEVIEHLVDKYGQDYVAGISNYSTLASASALRDCGRVYGLSGLDLSPTKLVPKEGGKSSTLTEAAELVPEIQEFKERYIDIWHHAVGLEGCMRNLGKHAAGVVVAGEPIVNRAVVEKRSGAMVVNWDRMSVESWGLVKIDILGLSTLDILQLAVESIKSRRGEEIDLTMLPIDDYETMRNFSTGNAVSIFQFESGGIRHLLKELAKGGLLTFDDVSAATALYRPGPMESGLMDDYIAVKQGINDPEYEHENMRAALEETGGVIVFQEQVMQIARDLAGYSMAEADKLRKIMGKKQRDEMLLQKDKFVTGSVTHSKMDKALAGELFDKIEKFAGYGFCKSHAVEYSIISYWCVSGKTKIYDWDNERYITVAKAFREGVENIACYDEKTGKTISGRVKKVIRTTGAKNVDLKMGWVMRTKSNKRLECSDAHLILTPNGYKKLKELKPGDMIASEKRVSIMGAERRANIASALKKQWSESTREERGDRVAGMHERSKDLRRAAAKLGWSRMSDVERMNRVGKLIDSAKGGTWSARKTGVVSECGHRFASSNEKAVCEWLNMHGVEHESQVWVKTGFADWKVKGVYVEYDGVGRKESYFERKYGDSPYIVIRSLDEIDSMLSFALEEELMRAGALVSFEPIVSITQTKMQVMYDIVMEKDPHNFLADGVVVHNCMYLKTHYAPEYFAATMSVVDKDEKLKAAVNDAKKNGITVLPPNINVSSNVFEIKEGEDEVFLCTPFNKLKGLSDKTCAAIAEAKAKVGKFTSKAHFLESVNKVKVNKRHQKVLDSVGAFADIEPDQIASRHPDRLKDQMELMPGLIVEYIKADRTTNVKDVTLELSANIRNFRACQECNLKDKPHCTPTAGGVKLKYMVVSDCPSWSEEQEGVMFAGKSTQPVELAMKSSGVRKSNGFFTSLVRANKSEKRLTNEQVNGCKRHLDEEVAIIKPPVIVCLGGASIRHFVPDVKGGWKDLCGQVVYSKELDANIVFGINPGMVAFRDEAQGMLDDVFAKVDEIIN